MESMTNVSKPPTPEPVSYILGGCVPGRSRSQDINGTLDFIVVLMWRYQQNVMPSLFLEASRVGEADLPVTSRRLEVITVSLTLRILVPTKQSFQHS